MCPSDVRNLGASVPWDSRHGTRLEDRARPVRDRWSGRVGFFRRYVHPLVDDGLDITCHIVDNSLARPRGLASRVGRLESRVRRAVSRPQRSPNPVAAPTDCNQRVAGVGGTRRRGGDYRDRAALNQGLGSGGRCWTGRAAGHDSVAALNNRSGGWKRTIYILRSRIPRNVMARKLSRQHRLFPR